MSIDESGKPIHPLIRSNEQGNSFDKKQITFWSWKAGENNLFTINPRDSYGNKIPNFNYQLLSFSHNLSVSTPLKMRSEIRPDGRLQISANTTSTDAFKFSITYGESHILNSPIEGFPLSFSPFYYDLSPYSIPPLPPSPYFPFSSTLLLCSCIFPVPALPMLLLSPFTLSFHFLDSYLPFNLPPG